MRWPASIVQPVPTYGSQPTPRSRHRRLLPVGSAHWLEAAGRDDLMDLIDEIFGNPNRTPDIAAVQ
jgi:hypothetical protein